MEGEDDNPRYPQRWNAGQLPPGLEAFEVDIVNLRRDRNQPPTSTPNLPGTTSRLGAVFLGDSREPTDVARNSRMGEEDDEANAVDAEDEELLDAEVESVGDMGDDEVEKDADIATGEMTTNERQRKLDELREREEELKTAELIAQVTATAERLAIKMERERLEMDHEKPDSSSEMEELYNRTMGQLENLKKSRVKGESRVTFSPIPPVKDDYFRPTPKPRLSLWKPDPEAVKPTPKPRRSLWKPDPPVEPKKLVIPIRRTKPATSTTSKTGTKSMSQTTPVGDPGIETLANAIVAALQSQNRTTERFIARQGEGSKLPQFSGHPLDWPLFASHYRQSTQDCGYTEATNTNRLIQALKGDAMRTVQSLLITPTNASVAMERLEERYGRPEIIIQALVEKASKCPSAKDGKLSNLLDFSNAVGSLVTIIKSLQEDDHLNNPQLLKELVDKLPDNLKLEWGRMWKSLRREATLERFAEWIGEIAQAVSYVNPPRFTEKKKPDGVFVATEDEKKTSPRASTKSKGCEVCEKTNHKTEVCFTLKKMTVDDRMDVVRKKKLCVCCLKVGHMGRDCEEKKPCGTEGCKATHHKLLHGGKRLTPEKPKSMGDKSGRDDPPPPGNADRVSEINANLYSGESVLLRVLPITLMNGRKRIIVNALLDEGSTVSLIKAELATELQLTGPTDPLSLKWTNGTSQQDYASKRVPIFVSPVGEKSKWKLKNVRTIDDLSLPIRNLEVGKLLEDWPHLTKQKFKYLPDLAPQILIGQPHIKYTVARKVIEGPEGAPMLTKTLLGWCLHGPLQCSAEVEQVFSCFHETDDELMSRLVRESFQLEAVGISNFTMRSKDDIAAEAKMKQVTRRIDDRFETGLLWRTEDVVLPPSRDLALKRFHGVERKFSRDPELKKQYWEKMDHYLKTGYARKVTEEELRVRSPKEWYLPHFATTHPNKPGKIRIVFDAAARSHGVSLNDLLLTGPDLLNSLPGILIKFRQKKIAFGGDITEMFHQVRIRPEDCPAQRFIWKDKEDKEPSTYQLEVMMFGSVCSPYCAQYVLRENAKENQKDFPEAAKAVEGKHYMDDYLDSQDDDQKSIQSILNMKEIHRRGGFHIGKWISNSKEVLAAVNEVKDDATCGKYPRDEDPALLYDVQEKKEQPKNLASWSDVPTERTLGLHWDPDADVFTYKLNLARAGDGIATGEVIPTKRAVLRLVMLVWDPLGFLSHFLILPRLLLQSLWKNKLGWDDEISAEAFEIWKKWVRDLPRISHLKIPRCYSTFTSSSPEVQIHVFADASEVAYCCATYIRIRSEEKVDVSLVMAKSRVAPLKLVSVPRLELQAALIGARMGKFIAGQLEIEVGQTYLWTDSITVLKWIRSDVRRYHQFVANRVGEIHEISQVAQWKWVPTKENVADEGTRHGRKELTEESRWWKGPDFLKLDPDEWPEERSCQSTPITEDELELKKEFAAVAVLPIASPTFNLPDVTRFSKWYRIVRTTAWILKYKENCWNCWKKIPRNPILPIIQAQMLLFKRAQWESFPEDMARLLNRIHLPKSSPLYQLSPILDQNGVLRMDSRVTGSNEPFVKMPIILMAKHPLTVILMSHYHRLLLHQGEDAIRNEMRQKFYISHLRSAIRKVVRRCGLCQIRRAKTVTPMMGALPEIRVSAPPRAFTIVGMDYFGPMEVTIGRRHEKRYGVLFTCMNTRAVHLEIAHSLTTDSCIMAIRRMTGRRGEPTQIWSDNGTNLRGAEREMREAIAAMDQTKMTQELSIKAIDWHFLPPGSPHMAGVWERLVRSVKSALAITLKTRAPREEVLQTLFTEAEAVVNSRPLTDVPVDPASPEALTPFHFLIGTSSVTQPPGDFKDEKVQLTRWWKQSQIYADLFWKRWLREYIPTLQRRKKWHDRVPSLKIGDVVIVLDESLKRGNWPLGQITQVFPGRDGVIRVAEVRTAHGVYKRPIVKLAKLDTAPQEGS